MEGGHSCPLATRTSLSLFGGGSCRAATRPPAHQRADPIDRDGRHPGNLAPLCAALFLAAREVPPRHHIAALFRPHRNITTRKAGERPARPISCGNPRFSGCIAVSNPQRASLSLAKTERLSKIGYRVVQFACPVPPGQTPRGGLYQFSTKR